MSQLNTVPRRHLTKAPFRQFTTKPLRYLATGSFYRELYKNFDNSQANHFDRSIKSFRYIATSSVPHPTEESLRYLAQDLLRQLFSVLYTCVKHSSR